MAEAILQSHSSIPCKDGGMRFFVSVAAPIAALALSGCVATASMGAPATPPPAPTPQPPQVIYLQSLATQASQPASDNTLTLIIALVVAMSAGAVIGVLVALLMTSRSSNPTEASYFASMLQMTVTPA